MVRRERGHVFHASNWLLPRLAWGQIKWPTWALATTLFPGGLVLSFLPTVMGTDYRDIPRDTAVRCFISPSPLYTPLSKMVKMNFQRWSGLRGCVS